MYVVCTVLTHHHRYYIKVIPVHFTAAVIATVCVRWRLAGGWQMTEMGLHTVGFDVIAAGARHDVGEVSAEVVG